MHQTKNNMKTIFRNVLIAASCLCGVSACTAPKDEAKEVVDIIYKVNNYWQAQNHRKYGGIFPYR